MKEFFRGWPRKWGMLTLILALGLVLLWMRSHTIVDQIQYRSSKEVVQVVGTEPQGLVFVTLRDADGVLELPRLFESRKQDFELTALLQNLAIHWNWEFTGLRYFHPSSAAQDSSTGIHSPSAGSAYGGSTPRGTAFAAEAGVELSIPMSDPVSATCVFVVPYWPVVLVLTLLATLLFLSRPASRQRTSPPQSTGPGEKRAGDVKPMHQS